MTLPTLVVRHLRRNWLRTLSTVAAMTVCIFLICTLRTVIAAVEWGLQSANASRLVTRHAVSLVFNVPLAYKARIAAVPGVRAVATTSWFGGSLVAKREVLDGGAAGAQAAGSATAGADSGTASSGPDFANFFPNLAVDMEIYLPVYPELIVSEDQRRALMQDRRGCLIGRGLAGRFGWKIGDTFHLESFIPPYRRREGPFEFIVRAIYDVDEARFPGTDDSIMLFHYAYLYEGTGQSVGAGTYTIAIDDPTRAAAVSEAIDDLFENSDAQTYTETEAAFRAGFIALAGNLALLLNGIGLTVAFTILLVTANTMSMAVRERRTEIAVLKTLGFPGGTVLGIILGEGLLLGALGGGFGLGFGAAVISVLPSVPFIGDAVSQFPGGLRLTPPVAGFGLAVALLLGLMASLVPALIAYRSRITDMLRQA